MKSKEVSVLKPFSKIDVLYYYSQVAKKLARFLKGREIATKIYLPTINILKRGTKETKEQPLFIDEIKADNIVNEKFLKLRSTGHLEDARGKITKQQEKLWTYFVPRKLIEMHYAVNTENTKSKINRIYFDIDKRNLPSSSAQLVAKELIETIKKDKSFKLPHRFFILWTGSSFHVYLLLKKKISHSDYEKLFQIKQDKRTTFVEKWVSEINVKFKNKNFNVSASHEKKKNYIIIDPSQSPPGKLARCPFSLHIKNYKEVDGIAIPISEKQLNNLNLTKELKNLTPKKVLKNLGKYSKLL